MHWDNTESNKQTDLGWDMGFIYDGKTPSLSSVCDVKTCENVQGGEYTTEKPDQVSSSSILFVELT